MAVKGPDATTVAQENQIPPTLRNWIRSRCTDVRVVQRYNSGNEHTGCGYVIEAESAMTRTLPDGFEVRKIGSAILSDASVRIAIRDV